MAHEQSLLTGNSRIIQRRYPYGLSKNPFPDDSLRLAPSPGPSDPCLLGGRLHKEAEIKILSSVSSYFRLRCESKDRCGNGTRARRTTGFSFTYNRPVASDGTFSTFSNPSQHQPAGFMTITGATGSGKTQLARHIRNNIEMEKIAVTSYTDLSRYSTTDIGKLYNAIVTGFREGYFNALQNAIISYLLVEAELNSGPARKIFNYDFVDAIDGRKLSDNAAMLRSGESKPNSKALEETLLESGFSNLEAQLINEVLMSRTFVQVLDSSIENDNNALDETNDDVKHNQTFTFEELSAKLGAIAGLNTRLLQVGTIIQLDNVRPDSDSSLLFDNLANTHLSSMIFMLIYCSDSLPPSNSLKDLICQVDLADTNTFDEISEIVLEYLSLPDIWINNTTDMPLPADGSSLYPELSESIKQDLCSKLWVVFEEFRALGNTRSMLELMRHAFEDAFNRRAAIVDEQALDCALKSRHPELSARSDTMMGVPLTEFITIKSSLGRKNGIKDLENPLKRALRELATFANEVGIIAKPIALGNQTGKNSPIELLFRNQDGLRTALALVLLTEDEKTQSNEKLCGVLDSTRLVDRIVILTNAEVRTLDSDASAKKQIRIIDVARAADLLFFSGKYENGQVEEGHYDQAIALAKALGIV